jgi:hypothetical protein
MKHESMDIENDWRENKRLTGRRKGRYRSFRAGDRIDR